ncbi:MAG: hypothetical protein ACXWJZ_02775 [Burkholderiaceae bacterium]
MSAIITLVWLIFAAASAYIILKKDKLTVACEISVTTTVEHGVANLMKCLQVKFSHIIFICKDKRRRDKVQKFLASTQPEAANIIYNGTDNIVVALDQIDPQSKPLKERYAATR